jgi:hypothetical protein
VSNFLDARKDDRIPCHFTRPVTKAFRANLDEVSTISRIGYRTPLIGVATEPALARSSGVNRLTGQGASVPIISSREGDWLETSS